MRNGDAPKRGAVTAYMISGTRAPTGAASVCGRFRGAAPILRARQRRARPISVPDVSISAKIGVSSERAGIDLTALGPIKRPSLKICSQTGTSKGRPISSTYRTIIAEKTGLNRRQASSTKRRIYRAP